MTFSSRQSEQISSVLSTGWGMSGSEILQNLMAAVEEGDPELFTDHIKEFDSLTRLVSGSTVSRDWSLYGFFTRIQEGVMEVAYKSFKGNATLWHTLFYRTKSEMLAKHTRVVLDDRMDGRLHCYYEPRRRWQKRRRSSFRARKWAEALWSLVLVGLL